MKKLSNAEAEFEKTVVYRKNVYSCEVIIYLIQI